MIKRNKAEEALKTIIHTFRDEIAKNKTFRPSAKDYPVESKLTSNHAINNTEKLNS